MGMRWEEFVEFVKTGLSEFRYTDFGQVRYGDQALATWLGLAIAGLLALKIVHVAVSRRKHSRHHSGHFIAFEHRRGTWAKAIHTVPKLISAVAFAFLEGAMVAPFLTST